MEQAQSLLQDSFGRIHDYLRISLIDTCNFSCSYCVPMQKPEKKLQAHLMAAHEIESLAAVFVSLGVKKIRLTGGEPLLRKDLPDILQRLKRLNIELVMTTNGYLLDRYFDTLHEAGIRELNISLDTLRPERFAQMTRFEGFRQVHQNILKSIEHGFRVKVNAVLMRGTNDDELYDFIEWSGNAGVDMRFIEYMPFSSNNWQQDLMVSSAELLERISNKYQTEKLPDGTHDTSRKFRIKGYTGTVAFISTVTEPFCSGCNRLRLTADGKLRNCLFSQSHTDLLTPLRKGENVRALISGNLEAKALKYGGQIMDSEIQNSEMILIGG